MFYRDTIVPPPLPSPRLCAGPREGGGVDSEFQERKKFLRLFLRSHIESCYCAVRSCASIKPRTNSRYKSTMKGFRRHFREYPVPHKTGSVVQISGRHGIRLLWNRPFNASSFSSAVYERAYFWEHFFKPAVAFCCGMPDLYVRSQAHKSFHNLCYSLPDYYSLRSTAHMTVGSDCWLV